MKILNNHSLHRLNTFKVKAFAKFFAEVFSVDELLELLVDKKTANEKKLILGGGSNILFTKDFNGLVVKNSITGINIVEEDKDSVLINAGGGAVWDELVQFCVEKNYGGIENLSLIPGTVGAAPMQNIGAYGQELSETFHSLDGIFIENSEEKTFTKDDCKFEYRSSIFKQELKDKFIIHYVRLRLTKNQVVQTDYGEIKKYLDKENVDDPTISDIRKIIVQIRKSKFPDLSVIGNAGSFFKNPVVDKKRFEIIKSEYDDIAAFKVDKNKFKISAGWLIEKCGWKGRRIGNTGTYSKHGLIIVNHDGATGVEILETAMRIKKEVELKFAIILEEEVNLV
ncbi:MAG: UDP-N-acetylmuramate dehydrogenase [Ignavibacteria bacterium]|nr:UDP-N-acetylmuramate dehydrogenase [Ignavibacteria bacterium]